MEYDALGRVSKTYNPECVGTSAGFTLQEYDGLSRVTRLTYQDNSVLKIAYQGDATIERDPARKWKKTISDAAGRLNGG